MSCGLYSTSISQGPLPGLALLSPLTQGGPAEGDVAKPQPQLCSHAQIDGWDGGDDVLPVPDHLTTGGPGKYIFNPASSPDPAEHPSTRVLVGAILVDSRGLGGTLPLLQPSLCLPQIQLRLDPALIHPGSCTLPTQSPFPSSRHPVGCSEAFPSLPLLVTAQEGLLASSHFPGS